MAENPPHQQIKPAYSASDVDVHSLDSTYLSLCVRFAQSHGIYPASSALHPDTSMVYDEPRSLPHPRNQDAGSVSDHQDPITGGLSGHYPRPYISNVFTDTCYPQHDRDHDSYSSSYMETTAPDLTYAQHNSNPFISNDVNMNIDSNLSPDLRNDPQHQASNPFASDATAPSLSENPHSAPQPTQFPKKILQPRHLSSTSEIGDKGLAVLHNYDPLWVQNTGADRSSVFEFSSKMKFEELFRGGVIRKGDKLVIAYTRAFSGVFDKEVATLTYVGFSKPVNPHKNRSYFFFPDLTLTLSSHPSFTHVISACNGTTAIMREFSKCNISGPEITSHLAKNLHVWRGDQDLGTFLFVRQAYHTWMTRKDAEAERMGASWRRNRRGDSSKVVGVLARKEKGNNDVVS